MMPVCQRREKGDNYPRFGIGLLARIYQSEIVSHEIIPIVWPGTRVGVIYSQMDDTNVSSEVHRFPVLLLVEIRPERTLDKCRSVLPEITHLIVLAQKHLKLRWVGIIHPVFDSGTIGDTVSNAGHFYLSDRSAQ